MALSKKKKEEISEEKGWQQVDSAVIKSEKFLEKYQTQLLYVAGAIVIIVLAYLGYKNFYLQPRNEEAQVALFKGEQYFEAGKDSLAIFGDGNGYLGFEVIADTYGSTKAGDLAKAYAGICYARMGNNEKAIDKLSDYKGGDKLFTYQAKVTLADCYVNTGKLDEAVKLYADAGKKADNPIYSPIYYKKAAMVYREQKNYDKAIELFTLIKNNYMNSSEASDADKYIEEANILKGGSK